MSFQIGPSRTGHLTRLDRHSPRPDFQVQTGHFCFRPSTFPDTPPQTKPPQTGQPQTRYPNSDQKVSHLTSQFQPGNRAGHGSPEQTFFLPLTKHTSSESHGLRPNIKTQTGHASSDLTSQLRLVSFGQDLQVQGERPQSQTRCPRSGRIPTQIQRPRTGHPCSDRTVTASGQTCKFTMSPDMRAQPGQP